MLILARAIATSSANAEVKQTYVPCDLKPTEIARAWTVSSTSLRESERHKNPP